MVAELRIWVLGGEALTSSLRTACAVDRPPPEVWLERLAGERPSFVLVEADESIASAGGAALVRLLEACEAAAVPRFLWFTSGPVDPFWTALCDRFDRVFAADRDLLPTLEAAGASMPGLLWPAAPTLSDAGGGPRPDPLVWLGGWRREWPEHWRERLAAVLEAAGDRGLRIAPVESLDGLPAGLRPHVDDVVARGTEAAALRRARVAVAADPTIGAPGYCSPSIFAAAAHGAAVVTPHGFTVNFEFAIAEWRRPRPLEAIAQVRDAGSAGLEIDRLLGDERLRRDVVAHTRRILANNHTASHRVATLASATGLRLIPDAPDPAPA